MSPDRLFHLCRFCGKLVCNNGANLCINSDLIFPTFPVDFGFVESCLISPNMDLKHKGNEWIVCHLFHAKCVISTNYFDVNHLWCRYLFLTIRVPPLALLRKEEKLVCLHGSAIIWNSPPFRWLSALRIFSVLELLSAGGGCLDWCFRILFRGLVTLLKEHIRMLILQSQKKINRLSQTTHRQCANWHAEN